MSLAYVGNGDSRVYNLFDKLKKEHGKRVDDMLYTCENWPVFDFTQKYQDIF